MIWTNVEYAVPLDDGEMLVIAGELSGVMKQIADEKQQLKDLCAEFRERIKNLTSDASRLCECLRTKREKRSIACMRVDYDNPAPGTKSIYDANSGRLLEVLDMTEEDREDLFAQQGAKED